MQKTNQAFHNYNGERYPINTHKGEYYCYSEILEAGIRELNSMLFWHSKVLAIRLDVHANENTKLNSNISLFVDNLKKFIMRTYSTKRVGYVWVRETSTSKNQHYHLHIFVDGNKVQTSYKINNFVKRYFDGKRSTYHFPKNCYKMTYRENKESIDEVINRFSYLAKVNTKCFVDKNVRNYSSSRIKSF